ncbi:MAG: riboflavin synthase [Chitinophagaceae bacterium]|nr:MAG: riboflavin synthase [Chitinophagaceae bacterium]
MFTGIIQSVGKIRSLEINGTNISFWVESELASQLKIDQSLSHNGVCLTVEAIEGQLYKVTAIAETLQKTNLGSLKAGSSVNLEPCMQLNGRLDGHIVQGHVDGTAVCTSLAAKGGSWEYRFQFDEKFASLVIEKGSITLNGISLTIFDVTLNEFSIAIIPYTFEHTNMNQVREGDIVNLEFDMIGKYVNRIASLK